MRLFALLIFTGALAYGGPISIAQVNAFIHADGSLQTQLDGSSPTFFSTLDPDNIGSFEWTFTNTTGLTLTNVSFLAFLDADIDRDTNTFFNEYGTFISLGLPALAPGGALTATSWEIDEPGFVFGDIYNNLFLGALDNTNAVPSSTPDDVSLALGFLVGNLAPNQAVTGTFFISLNEAVGLQQTDPASDFSLYWNGYTTISDAGPSPVPEPSTLALLLGGLALLTSTRLRRGWQSR